ncbi:23S rRNA (pseudouridine(1915)-N(3))-methyltransferase RlmH [Candidatus Uhrbacteria bacterium]|nr:23S rRNA (pseudouridine(1915)-N(3))-methyltransferase RlmH [Candidatus Uhrbacteria bacterium]
MQRIVIRAIGKVPQGWQRQGVAEYLERLTPFSAINVIELPEGHDGTAKPDLVRTQQTEAISLLKSIPEDSFVIAVDETGTTFSSTSFADHLAEWSTGGKTLVFILGGSWGLDERVRARANFILSFGKLTFPHALARIILLEQLYRAAMIQSGKTYHK